MLDFLTLESIGFRKYVVVPTQNPDIVQEVLFRAAASVFNRSDFENESGKIAALQKDVLATGRLLTPTKPRSGIDEDNLFKRGEGIRYKICQAAQGLARQSGQAVPIEDSLGRITYIGTDGRLFTREIDPLQRSDERSYNQSEPDERRAIQANEGPLSEFEHGLTFPADRATYKTLAHSYSAIRHFMADDDYTEERLLEAVEKIKGPLRPLRTLRSHVNSFDQNSTRKINRIESRRMRDHSSKPPVHSWILTSGNSGSGFTHHISL